MPRAPRPTAVLLLLLAGGCSGYKAPMVRVGEASLAEVAEEAMRLEVSVEFENPNAEPLELRSLRYTLSVDGRPVYSGRRAAQATLARSGVKTISIPGVVRYDLAEWDGSNPPVDAEWSVRGEVVYVTPSELAEILLDAKLLEPTAAFAGSGTVRLTGSSAP